MNFCCTSGDVVSINDKQIHHVNAQETMICFKNALSKVKTDRVIYSDLPHDDDILLSPRDDRNYTMIDELFEQFIPTEKWASVSITGKDGKPFYIKDKWKIMEIIMRCETSVVGNRGNNETLNCILDKLYARPEPNIDEDNEHWNKRYNEWSDWWGAKPHVCDMNIFDVSLFSTCYVNGCTSFVNPKTGKVGLLTNCRWSHEPINIVKEELQWICDNICNDDSNLEFYVSFFNEDINYLGKYSKEFKDPQFTLKLSKNGIELVRRIPIKNMKWVFKCNQNLHGKEWKKAHFLFRIKCLIRNIQEKLFPEKYNEWKNYTYFGDGLNSISTLGERYYKVDEIIKMIGFWKDCCALWCEEKDKGELYEL